MFDPEFDFCLSIRNSRYYRKGEIWRSLKCGIFTLRGGNNFTVEKKGRECEVAEILTVLCCKWQEWFVVVSTVKNIAFHLTIGRVFESRLSLARISGLDEVLTTFRNIVGISVKRECRIYVSVPSRVIPIAMENISALREIRKDITYGILIGGVVMPNNARWLNFYYSESWSEFPSGATPEVW